MTMANETINELENVELITVTNTAKLLCVHRSTVYRLMKEDTSFPRVYDFKFGKRFNKNDILHYIHLNYSSL